MSKTIDEKVVSFQFENNKFQKKVKDTLSSLEKLKDKLKFKDTKKELKDLQSTTEDMDFSEMSAGLTTVSKKFNALQTMAEASLSRIATKAVDAGTTLVKSLTIDQVTAGWNKLESKTASVQTIMNSTGASIEEVNSWLDKLMWFADETSYSFTDMTASLGQLTASGGDVQKLLPMIMGVANATAYAGKTTSEFSRAIYNLNQSYSAGNLQLMDWKSLELAGVASKALKETLVQAGVEVGTLKKKKGKVYDNKGNIVNASTFNSTLSSKWANKSVMEKAFGEFYKYTDIARQRIESGEFETATEAYRAMLDENSALADDIYFRAAKAAQEAKSFQEVVDATKDAVSSGWMTSFEKIFGNYDEARALWSNVAEDFWSLFASGGSRRNDILSAALDPAVEYTENFIDMVDNMGIDINDVIDGIYNEAEKAGVSLDDILKDYNDIEDALRHGAVESDWIKNVFSDDQLNTLNEYEDSLSDVIDMMVSTPLGGREMLHTAIHSFLQALVNIKTVIDDVKESVFGTFVSDTIYKAIEGIHKFATGFQELTAITSRLNDEGEELTDEGLLEEGYTQTQINNFKMLTSIFESLFSILKLGASIVRVVVTFFTKLASAVTGLVVKLLPNFIVNVEGITGWINSLVAAIQNWLDESTILETVIGGIVYAISSTITYVKDLVKKLWELPAVQNAIQKLKDNFDAFKESISNFWTDLRNKDWKEIFMAIGQAIIDGFMIALDFIINTDWKAVFTKVYASASKSIGNFIDTIKDKVKLSSEQMEKLKKVLQWIGDYGYAILAGLIAFTGIKKVLDIIEGLLVLPVKIGELFESIGGVFKSMSRYLDAKAMSIRVNTLLKVVGAIALLVGALWVLAKIDSKALKTALVDLGIAMTSMVGLVVVLGIVSKLLGKNGNLAKNMKTLGTTFLLLSISAVILAKAFKSMENVKNVKNTLAIFGAVLGGVMLVLTVISGMDRKGQSSVSVLKIIGAIIAMKLLLNVLKSMSKTSFSFEQILNIIENLGLCVAALWAFIKISDKLTMGKGKAAATIGTVIAVSLSMLILVILLKRFSNMDPYTLVAGLAGMIPVFLTLKALFKLAENVGEGAKNSGLFMIGIAAAVLMLTLAIKKLGEMDTDTLKKGSIAATLLTLAMGSIAALMSVITKGFSSGSLKQTAAIGLIALALSASLYLLVGVIKLMSHMDTNDIKKGTEAIVALLLGLAAPMYAMSKIKFGPDTFKSMIVLATMIGLVLAAFIALSFVGDINKVSAIAIALTEMFGGLTGVFIGFGILSKLSAGFNMQAALSLIELIGTITLVIGAVVGLAGALSKIEGINDFISAGGKVLTEVGAAIGGLVGGLVGGIANGAMVSATKDIEVVGTRLSNFGNNIKPFLEMMNDSSIMSEQSIANARSLIGLLSYLTTQDIQDTLSDSSTFGLNYSMTNLKSYFEKYGEAIVALSAALSKGDVDIDKISQAAKAGTDMVAVVNALPKTDSTVAKWFGGEKSFSTFVEGMKEYISALIEISGQLNDKNTGGLDEKGINKAITVGKKIGELLNAIPESGSEVKKFFSGEKSLTDFATGITDFITGLTGASKTLTENPIDDKALSGAKKLGEMMANLAESIPDSASLKSLLSGGNKDLGAFGEDIASFVESVISIPNMLMEAGGYKPGDDMSSNPIFSGLRSMFESLTPFGESVKNLGKNISEYDTKQGKEVISQIKELLQLSLSFNDSNLNKLVITPVLDETAFSEMKNSVNAGMKMPLRFGETSKIASNAVSNTVNNTTTRNSTVTNNINMTVNGTSGQSATQIADIAYRKLRAEIQRTSKVWD